MYDNVDIDYLIVDKEIDKSKKEFKKLNSIIPQFNVFHCEDKPKASDGYQRYPPKCVILPTNPFDNNDDSELYNEYISNLNINMSNRKYLNPPFARKSYIIPRIFSHSLAIKNRQTNINPRAIDFGLSETINFKTKFPQTLSYERVCPQQPPYIAPILISLLHELDKHAPPLYRITSGSCQRTLDSADALFDTLLTVHINKTIPKQIAQIYFLNVTVSVLTNTLQVLFQRLKYPLFLATSEFCHIITSNKHDIKLIHFGCYKYEENEVINSLVRCLAISSNFQIANLAYFIEICQRWMKKQIQYELDRKPMGSAETIYEDAAANIAMVFGKTLIGIPKSFVAYKIMNNALPLVDDIRRIIVYFLLGIPPFEFWHLWSISSLCFEDSEKKCKCKRGAFLPILSPMSSFEALPNL